MSDRLLIGVCGLGLIGSSVVRGLAGRHDLLGVDPDAQALATATELGVRSAASWQELGRCDLVLLAAPTAVNESILEQLMAEGVTVPVADLGSVKGPIDRAWRRHSEFPFVGTHPMAGSERSGAPSGTADLFLGSAWPVIVDEATDSRALVLVLRLILELGGQPIPMSADCHDRAVALASHLPHLLSGALGATVMDSPVAPLAIGLAAGSFRDVSRVGGSPPLRTAEFVTENAVHAATAARRAAAQLERAAELLERGDVHGVARWLTPARDARRLFEDRAAAGENSRTVGAVTAAELRAFLVAHADTGLGIDRLDADPDGQLTVVVVDSGH